MHDLPGSNRREVRTQGDYFRDKTAELIADLGVACGTIPQLAGCLWSQRSDTGMTRKKMLLIGAVLVVGLYFYLYRDWFGGKEMQIYHRLSAGSPVRKPSRTNQIPAGASVAFGFGRKYEFTDLKVIAVGELKTNPAALPLWHLVSDSNSVPVSGFLYGERIRGMRPAVKKARPEPLQSNVTYRLIVDTGRQKGQHDFTIAVTVPPAGE